MRSYIVIEKGQQMSRQLELTLTFSEEDWVEIVHALAHKMDWVGGVECPGGVPFRKKWLSNLKRIYDKISSLVEEAGIEC